MQYRLCLEYSHVSSHSIAQLLFSNTSGYAICIYAKVVDYAVRILVLKQPAAVPCLQGSEIAAVMQDKRGGAGRAL